jgi:branched-chain amino acid transport system permease protein
MNIASAATRTVTLGAVLWVLAALLPTLLLSNYHLFQLTMVVVYAIAILGLAILTGFNGQISLGHGAFYAIGAYVTAVLMYQYDVPYWATLPVSAVVCAAVGFLIGLPALRLGGLYLALTTFALAVAVPQILKINLLEGLTGGVQGLVIDKPDPPFDLPMSADQWLYLFSLAVAGVLFLLAWNVVRGRTGRSMMAVRDHALAAEAMGIDIALLKTRSFALSAMYTGIAGSLGAIVVQFVAPDSFSIFVSIYFFVGLLVGGVSSIGGAILGGLFVEFVPNVAESISKAAPGAIYGVILIAVMFLMPSGAAGFLGALLNRCFRRGSKSGELAPTNVGGSGADDAAAATSLSGGDGSDADGHLRLQKAERLYPATTAAGGRGEAVATGGAALPGGDGERGRL